MVVLETFSIILVAKVILVLVSVLVQLQLQTSNFIMKCDKRTQNIESSVRMTVQKNIKKQNT